MKTAVEWLVEQMRLRRDEGLSLSFYDLEMFAKKAKQMEKEHIEEAFNSAKIIKNYKGERKFSYLDLDDYSDEKYETFEQYYNETFKSE